MNPTSDNLPAQSLEKYLGHDVVTENDADALYNMIKSIKSLTVEKLSVYASGGICPIPPNDSSPSSLLWDVTQTISIITSALNNPHCGTTNKSFAQSMYLLCICASGGVLSKDKEDEIVNVYSTDSLVHQILNAFMDQSPERRYGNLSQMDTIIARFRSRNMDFQNGYVNTNNTQSEKIKNFMSDVGYRNPQLSGYNGVNIPVNPQYNNPENYQTPRRQSLNYDHKYMNNYTRVNNSQKMNQNPMARKFCSSCGTQASTPHCPGCGNRII